MRWLRKYLTYANVMATIAVFIALGGGAYALKLKKNSVGAKQLKKAAVTKKKIAAGAVDSPRIEDGSVGLVDAAPSLHQTCQAGTVYIEGACIEASQHGTNTRFVDARIACGPAGRLPSIAELDALGRRPGVTWTGFEWTNARFFDGTDYLVDTMNDAGVLGVNQDSPNGYQHYRCVYEPTG